MQRSRVFEAVRPRAARVLPLALISWLSAAACSGNGEDKPGGESGLGGTAGSAQNSGGSNAGSASKGGTGGSAPTAGSATSGSANGGSSAGRAGSAGNTANGGDSAGMDAGSGGTARAGSAAGGKSGQAGSGSSGSSAGGSDAGASTTGGSSGSGGSGAGGSAGGPGRVAGPLINGIQWADTDGNPIQAHGGGLLKVGDDYYWFGENRNADSTFKAVSAYRSRDLVNWEFVHDVLREDSGQGLDPANVERPKVVFNASTGKYVMWMHWENGSDYGEARAAVASSDSVDGDYTYHGSFRPLADSGVTDHGKPGYMSRDCTLFVDDDGKAYFISAADENYDLNLYELTPDYLEIQRLVATLFPDGHREAPAMFKRNGTYFLVTSAATGWDPNQAQYATSSSIGSGWSSLKNVADGNTFYSQSTFVLPVEGGGETSYLYLGDRWAGAWGGRVNDSTYVWQPISFPSATSMSMSWNNTLAIDTASGSVTGSTKNFQFLNLKSGKALDVEDASSEDGARIVQNAPSNADSQSWSLNYDGAGFFRVTNVKSQKIIDVLDESTADGIELAQWENHGGDNQVWLVVDLGGGVYQLKNKKSGKFATVAGGSTADGANVEQRSSSDAEEQRWLIAPR